MVKELETLNDYIDGYLIAVYEEPDGNLKSGKTAFLECFRSQLANIASNEEGPSLIKILNRSLLKASNQPSTTLNKKKGFEEALISVQEKIKDLFKLDDLLTGTIAHYLQDIPKIKIGNKPNIERLMSGIDVSQREKAKIKIKEVGQIIEDAMNASTAVLEMHLKNNGKLIVISDEGYSELTDMDDDSLKNLIVSNGKSKEKLKEMIKMSLSIIERFANEDNKNNNLFN